MHVTISPWALPREEITLYVKLGKNVDFAQISITLPECFIVNDFINVIKKDVTDNHVSVYEIGRTDMSEFDYFGIVIATKSPFKELAVQKAIAIRLIEKNNSITDQTVYAKIFRPLLEISNIPESIKLTDTNNVSIPMDLKFSGFGDIGLRVEASIGGQIVSEGESLIDQIFHGLLKEGFVEKELREDNKDLDIQIDKNTVLNLINEFKSKLSDSDYVEQYLNDKETKHETVEWLKKLNEIEQEKFMLILYDTIEGFLTHKLTDLLTRTLSSNLHLDSGSKISAEIKAKVTELKIKILYKDLMDNEYDPLNATIQIIDNRKTISKIHVNIPIEIEDVDESNAYKNVESMKIGSS